ncbi:MAG: flagellar hook-length control protein FliK [Myxococcales bacterium]|nr:flagellar hook-length control protein FliK [Myxococcales bacterium]
MSGFGTKPSIGELGQRELPAEAESHGKSRDAARAAWIHALTTQLRGAFYQLPKGDAETSQASRGWHPAVGSLSPSEALFGDGAEETRALSSLRLDLGGGEHGDLSVLIQRGNAGVRVVFEVQTQVALEWLDAERQLLLETLRAQGLRVAGVEVCLGSGTALAQPEPHGSSLKTRVAEASRRFAADEQEERRSERRVNVVG